MYKILLFLFSFLVFSESFANDKNQYICGVAKGFPPYQFIDQNGKSAGLDVEITALVFKTASLDVLFSQDDWEVLLFNLVHKKKMIDMLCGAEITTEREQLLDFTISYYKRRTVLFSLKTNPIKKIEDLYGKIVAGDLHSNFEKMLGDRKSSIRITKTTTKEESFKKLKEKNVVAVIAPVEVGMYLSKKMGIEIQVFDLGDIGSPVGIAVKKGDKKLIDILNTALKKLINDGQIDKILKRYGQLDGHTSPRKTYTKGTPALLATSGKKISD